MRTITHTSIGRLTAIVFLPLLLACNATSQKQKVTEPAPKPLTETSTFVTPITLQDQNAKPVEWQQLGGKVRVMAMIYTSCRATCPIITERIKSVERKLGSEVGDQVNYSLVSFDSKRDTPARLAAVYTQLGLNPHWQLLHAAAEDVRTISSLLDVQYQIFPDGNLTHSNVIVVLDRDGRIVLHADGVDPKTPDAVVQVVKQLLAAA